AARHPTPGANESIRGWPAIRERGGRGMRRALSVIVGASVVAWLLVLPATGLAARGQDPDVARAGGTLFFGTSDGVHGSELWKSDGTAKGTVMVKDINPAGSSYPFSLTAAGGLVYFR